MGDHADLCEVVDGDVNSLGGTGESGSKVETRVARRVCRKCRVSQDFIFGASSGLELPSKPMSKSVLPLDHNAVLRRMLYLSCGRSQLTPRNLQAWSVFLRGLGTANPQNERPNNARRPHEAAGGHYATSRRDIPEDGLEYKAESFSRSRHNSRSNGSRRSRGIVPFERNNDKLREILPESDDRSTVTPKELAAFRRLQALATAKSSEPAIEAADPEMPAPSHMKKTSPSRIRRTAGFSGLDALLDKSPAANTKSEKPGKAHEADSSKQDDLASSEEQERWKLKVNSIYGNTVSAIKAAHSDHQIWEILQREVFQPIKELDLDGPRIQLGGFPLADPEEMLDSEVVRLDPIDIIGANFANILRDAAEVLRTSFPNSPIQWSLIAELRRLGPTCFALGVTTDLYNFALEHVLLQDSNLSAGLDILDEMDREVIEPNVQTMEILGKVVKQAKAISDGHYGSAAKAVWSTERNQVALTEFRYRVKTSKGS